VKVRIDYTIDVSADERDAITFYSGFPMIASRADIADYLKRNGTRALAEHTLQWLRLYAEVESSR